MNGYTSFSLKNSSHNERGSESEREREGERGGERERGAKEMSKLVMNLKTEFFSQERNTWKSEWETADEFAQHFRGKRKHM
jgi:hypothetical protein